MPESPGVSSGSEPPPPQAGRLPPRPRAKKIPRKNGRNLGRVMPDIFVPPPSSHGDPADAAGPHRILESPGNPKKFVRTADESVHLSLGLPQHLAPSPTLPRLRLSQKVSPAA